MKISPRSIPAFLIAALIIQPSLSRADEYSNPSVGEVCSATLAKAKAAPTPAATSIDPSALGDQKLSMCQAAESQLQGCQQDKVLAVVWSSVAAFCVSACIYSLVGAPYAVYADYACTTADAGGSIAEAVITKDYTSALTNIGMLGATHMMGGGAAHAPPPAAEGEAAAKPKASSTAVCLTAAMATLSTVTKWMGAAANKKALQSQIDDIVKYKDTPTGTPPGNTAADTSAGGGGGGDSSAGGGGGQPNPDASTSPDPTLGGPSNPLAGGSNPGGTAGNNSGSGGSAGGGNGSGGSGPGGGSDGACAQGAAGGNALAVLKCAASSAANGVPAPGFITNPSFGKSFQDTTKIPLAAFLGKANDPIGALGAALSGQLSPSQNAAMEGLMAKMAEDTAASTGDPDLSALLKSTYSSGGGGGGGSSRDPSSEGDPDMMSLMAEMMSKFGPKKPGEEAQNEGLMKVISSYQKKSTSDIAEDRNLNIFDRITYRYYFIIKKNTL